MIQKLLRPGLVFLLLVSVLATSGTARSMEDTRAMDQRLAAIEQYSLPGSANQQESADRYCDSTIGTQYARTPAEAQQIPLGRDGAAVASSVGATVAETYDDWQYFYNAARVDFSMTVPSIHFSYGTKVDPDANVGYGYNVYDPMAGNWPRGQGLGCRVQPLDMSGYWPSLSVYPGGRVVLAGDDDASGNLDHHIYSNSVLHGCFFGAGSQIPPAQYTAGFVDTTHFMRFPMVEVQVYGADTITHMIGSESDDCGGDGDASDVSTSPVQYFRSLGTGVARSGYTIWTGPETIDTTSYRAHLTSSVISGKVAVIYFRPTATAYTYNNPGDLDVFYRESTNGGLSWGPKTNITNYNRSLPSHAPFVEKYGLYDSEDYLHILFSAQPWPANVYDLEDFFFDDFSVSLFHWSNRNPSIMATVANREYGIEWNQLVCGMGGGNSLYLAFFSLAECNGQLYVNYTGWHDIFAATPVYDDCASSWGSAPGRAYNANGEQYLQVSTSLDGILWDYPRNLTNTYTPECDSAGYGGVCMNEIKGSLAPYGLDEDGYGGSLTWEGTEFLDLDPGYTGSHFLNLLYLEDHYPGTAILERGDYTLNPLKWVRMGCVDPVTSPQIIVSPQQIVFPDYVHHGVEEYREITVTNNGNTTLNVHEIGFARTTQTGTDWLDVSQTAMTVLAGVTNTATFDVILNKSGIINNPGTVVELIGEVWLLSDAVNNDSAYVIVECIVADSVQSVTWDTATTHEVGLVVSNHGEAGKLGIGGVNMDFTVDGGDCDPDADVYLYDGSLYIMQDNGGGDFSLSTSLWSAGYGELAFTPLAVEPGMTGGTVTEYDSVFSGIFANWDTSLTAERTYYAPRNNPGNPSFIVTKTVIYAPGGQSEQHLSIGSMIDWDIPADNEYDNVSYISGSASAVYQQGTDIFKIPDNDCQYNEDRYGAEVFLGWYTSSNPGTYNESESGTFASLIHNWYDGAITGETYDVIWDSLSDNVGLASEPSTGDQATIMTFVHDYTLETDDTLTVYTVLVTARESSLAGFETSIEDARNWYIEYILPDTIGCFDCPNVDGDVSGIVDVEDVTAMINYLYLPPFPMPDPLCAADMDLVPGVNNNDMATLVHYLFIPPHFTPPCAPVADSVFPVSVGDTIDVRNTTVPPGYSEWQVEVYLKASSGYLAFAFPFSYDPSFTLDTIIYYSKFDSRYDDAPNRGLIRSNTVAPYTGGEKHAASLVFSVTPSGEEQQIAISPSSYPPSHTTVLSREGGSSITGVVPVFVTDYEAPETWMDSVTVSPVGSASVTYHGTDSIVVDNVGSSGDDGVLIDLDDPIESDGVAVDLGNVDLATTSATIGFEFTVEGMPQDCTFVAGRSPNEASTLGICFCGVNNVGGGTPLQVVADFTFLGDPNVLVKVFRDRMINGSHVVPGGGVIATGTSYISGLPVVEEVTMNAVDPPGFTVLLDRVIALHLVDGPTLYGDEIHVIAENATVSVEDIHAVEVTGSFLGFFSIPAVRVDACCRGFTGNVDADPTDIIDIGDLTELLSFLFIPPNEVPICLEEADVDGDPERVVDIGDVTAIIAYLYIAPNPVPARCR